MRAHIDCTSCDVFFLIVLCKDNESSPSCLREGKKSTQFNIVTLKALKYHFCVEPSLKSQSVFSSPLIKTQIVVEDKDPYIV